MASIASALTTLGLSGVSRGNYSFDSSTEVALIEFEELNLSSGVCLAVQPDLQSSTSTSASSGDVLTLSLTSKILD